MTKMTIYYDIPDAEYARTIELLVNRDVFRNECIGYWATGEDVRGEGRYTTWLLREDLTEEAYSRLDAVVEVFGKVAHLDGASLAWEAMKAAEGGPDLSGYRVLDRRIAERAIVEGLKLYGQPFITDFESEAVDVALQIAMLGEVTYQ